MQHCGVNNLSHTLAARQAQQSSCHVALCLCEVSFHCCSFFIQHATFSFEFYAPSAAPRVTHTPRIQRTGNPHTSCFHFRQLQLTLLNLTSFLSPPTVATSASTPAAAVVAFSFAYSTTFFSPCSAVLARYSLLGFLTFARPRHLHLFLPQRGGEKEEAQLSPVRQTH